MNKIIMLGALLSVSFAADTNHFITADDHLDMKSLVQDKERLEAYTECFLDKGPCDKISQSYRDVIPESLETACLRCNDAQKHLANTYLYGLKINHPVYYKEFLMKYDPEEKYMDKFMEATKDY